jgi:hypothetical protein
VLVRDGVAGVPVQVAWSKWNRTKYIRDRTDIKGRQYGGRPLIQHGHTLLLPSASAAGGAAY